MDRKTYRKQYKKRYKVFGEVLQSIRKQQVNISQVELAKRLSMKQSYVSKTETGERRLDIMELMEYCNAMDLCLTDFIFRLEWRLSSAKLISPKRQKQIKRWNDIYDILYKKESLTKK